MKLSEQIALLTTTLDEYGYDIGDGESAGQVAADVIRELAIGAAEPTPDELEFQAVTQSDKDRIAQLEDRIAELESELEGARDTMDDFPAEPEPDPMADVLPGPVIPCDDCTYLNNDRPIKRLCQNVDAIRRKFARRGYPTPVGHGCGLGRAK